MNRDDTGPSGRDPKKDYVEQGKQIASDLRDTVSKRVADNEDTLRGTLGKAARWVDEKTGGKYSDKITKAESAVGDGIGRVAAQSAGTGEPQGPGASAGDGTPPAAGPDGPLHGGPTPSGPTPSGPTDPPTRPTRFDDPEPPTTPR